MESRENFFEIAMKTIPRDASVDDFFTVEARNLESLINKCGDLPGLIKPIGACKSTAGDFILFPWASGGNLFEFWYKHDEDRLKAQKLLWILRQFTGLASTLAGIHKPNCRHGDLKPENILYFPPNKENNGSFQIADVGLTKFHEQSDTTNVRNERGQVTSTPTGTYRYVPPEVEITKDGIYKDARSRQYDVWSMGCILCELLVWMVYGHSTVREMRDEVDRYCGKIKPAHDPATKNSTPVIDPIVVRYLNGIESILQGRDSAQLSLLKLIRYSVLISSAGKETDVRDANVDTSKGSNAQPPKYRISAEQLHKELDSICRKCVDSRASQAMYLDVVTSSAPLSAAYTTGGSLDVPKKSGRDVEGSNVPRGAPAVSIGAPLPDDDGGETTGGSQYDFVPSVIVRPPTFDVRQNSRTMQDNQEVSEELQRCLVFLNVY